MDHLSSLMKLANNPQVRQLFTSLLGQFGGKGNSEDQAPAQGQGEGVKMAGLVQNLDQAGLGDHVKSWVGTGDNKPVSPAEITKAVGPEQLHQAAESAGMSDKQAADSLAKVLPQVVDQASPSGQAPKPNDFENLFNQLFGGQAQSSSKQASQK